MDQPAEQREWVPRDIAYMVVALTLGAVLVFMAALAIPPLGGTRIVWVLGVGAILGANTGLGTLIVGGYIEIVHRTWSRLHGIDYAVLAVSLLALAVADAVFTWWLFANTSSWIRWGFLSLALVAVVGGGVVSWFGLWPHHTGTESEAERWRPFSILSLLVGGGMGVVVAVVFLIGSAYLQNNRTPPARAIPIVHGIAGGYLAIGDSYSAGEGLTPFLPGTAETNCDRSQSQAYSEKLVFSPSRVAKSFTACSGAIIRDVLHPALRNGIVVPPQVDGQVHPDVGLVTLTIGGNNALFSKIVMACFEEAHCTSATFPPKGVTGVEDVKPGPLVAAWAPATLLAIGKEYSTLFPILRADFPHARIVVIGYPYLFPGGPARLSNLDCFSVLRRFSEPVRDGIRNLQTEFNDLTYEEAVAAHIEFVSPVAIWRGHEPCGDLGQYTNSIKPYLSFSNPIDGGTFHPNSSGQAALASLVACYLDANSKPPNPFKSGQAAPLTVPRTRLVSPSALGLVPGQGSAPAVHGCT
jgi:GDSL-like Lipase/Acylhydrolase family